MEQNRLEYLHHRYLEKTLSISEQLEWESVLASDEHEGAIKLLMEQTWHRILPEERIELSGKETNQLYNRIVGRRNVAQIRLWPKIAIVAALCICVLSLGIVIYHQNTSYTQVADFQYVKPGQTGATLTLASGKRVNLSDAATGKVSEEAGVVITKSEDGQLMYRVNAVPKSSNEMNVLSTANGQTYRLILPDGSMVWLNTTSSLRYPANFSTLKERRVRLEGEAYFQIAKDKSHPFIVESANQSVRVLGTHFNVNCYPDEPVVKTTLIEGQIKISSGTRTQHMIPGEQVVNNGSELKLAKIDPTLVTDWRDGEFNLDGADFRAAMRKISRWYDVEVVYDKSVPQDIETWGWISKNSKLSSVLKLIENSGQVKFRLEGKRLYVYK